MSSFARCLSLSLVIALVSSAATSVAQEEDLQAKLDNALAAGAQYLQDGDYAAAVQAYNEATTIAAFDPRGFVGRANAYRELKEYERALRDYQEAFNKSASGPSTELQYGRGKLYLDLGQYQLALPDLQAAYQAAPDNKEYRLALAKVYAMGGAGAEAEKLLNEILAEDDQNAEAYALRGRAFTAQQKNDLALADLKRSLELDDTISDTHFALGVVLWQQFDYEQAAAEVGKAIELYKAPDGSDTPFVQGYLTKASIHEDAAKAVDDEAAAAAQLDQCVEACDQLLEKLPKTAAAVPAQAGALLQKGIAQRLAGKFADAVRSFTEGINLNPTVAEAYFRRGICWHELNETQLAVGDFKNAQTLNYAEPRYYLWEGLSQAKAGEFYSAVEAYGEAISLSNRYVDAYLNRAHAYMKLGEFDKAIIDFNECIRLEPTTGQHYFKRGVAQSLAGQRDAAIQSFVNAIQFDARLIDSYDWLAEELTRAGDAALAAEYRAKAAELRGE